MVNSSYYFLEITKIVFFSFLMGFNITRKEGAKTDFGAYVFMYVVRL